MRSRNVCNLQSITEFGNSQIEQQCADAVQLTAKSTDQENLHTDCTTVAIAYGVPNETKVW